jgi:hypothetical protein
MRVRLVKEGTRKMINEKRRWNKAGSEDRLEDKSRTMGMLLVLQVL